MIKIDYIDDINTLKKCIDNNKINVITIPYNVLKKKKEIFSSVEKLNNNIEICIELDYSFVKDEKKILTIINDFHFKWIQFNSQVLIKEETLKQLYYKGIKIIYKSISSLDCDEDINWHFPSFSNDKNLSQADIKNIFLKYNIFLQFEIMGNYDNGWELLKKECGKYEEDLTIDELNNFMKEFNTFIKVDCIKNNVYEIQSILKYAYGIVCNEYFC